MLLNRLADLTVAGREVGDICAELLITEKMYGWLTGNDGFQLALEAAKARAAGVTAATSETDHGRG